VYSPTDSPRGFAQPIDTKYETVSEYTHPTGLSMHHPLSAAGWRWWLFSDAGTVARVSIGAAILAVLALVDVCRHGRAARRWREYLVLIFAAAAGATYGGLCDLLTSRISWEYFYFGKGLYLVLGSQVPPSAWPLAGRAGLVGIRSAWSAGLLAGAILLLANQPSTSRRSLPLVGICRLFSRIALVAVIGAALGGLAGRLGLLNWTSDDFRALAEANMFRPARFMTTYGIHLGSYLGGLAGTVLAVTNVVRRGTHHNQFGNRKFE
jgi:hypothetical protein